MQVDLNPWIQANLTLARGWIQHAIDGAATAAELLEAESNIDRATLALGDRLPMSWLSTRLGLTATERRVLWLAIAHELCPIARTMLRSLATETLSDPTTDALRRVAYAAEQTQDAWNELAPGGALRRWRLLERTDGGADVPEHRQTWRVASRLLALVHGEPAIDPELAELLAEPGRPTGIGGHGLVVDPASEEALAAGIGAVLRKGSGMVTRSGHAASGVGRSSSRTCRETRSRSTRVGWPRSSSQRGDSSARSSASAGCSIGS